jgi:DNA-binding MarR family transcriptional regulator
MQDDAPTMPVDLEIIAGKAVQSAKLELRLWLRMLSTVTLVSQEVRRRLREQFDITLPQFDMLAQLDREPGGLRLGELSKRMMVTNGNITGVIDRLEADGLLRREISAEDRRVTYARLTAVGRGKFRRYAKAHETWVRELLGDVDAATKATVLAHLAEVKASVARHRTNVDGD